MIPESSSGDAGEGSRTRTIADLDERDDIGPEHAAEAIQYRSLDRAPRR